MLQIQSVRFELIDTRHTMALLKKARKAARWMKHEIRDRCACHPGLFRAYGHALDRNRIDFFTTPGKHDLTLEGFGGSANSFAFYAIESCNPDLRIAHHLHVPASVQVAIDHKIPCIVMIREPLGSVVSLLSRDFIATPAQAFRHYTWFYEALLPQLDKVVVATFEEITTDMGAIMQRCNRKFGADLKLFEHTPENVEICFEKLKFEEARSSPRVQLDKSILRDEILKSPAVKQLERARRVYEAVLARVEK